MSSLAILYREARRRFEDDPVFQQRSRQRVVLLQAGDVTTREIWKGICAASRQDFDDIYRTLGVDTRLLERGESFYNDLLEEVVDQLVRTGVAVEAEGALCVFTETDDSLGVTHYPLSTIGTDVSVQENRYINLRCCAMQAMRRKGQASTEGRWWLLWWSENQTERHCTPQLTWRHSGIAAAWRRRVQRRYRHQHSVCCM